MNYDIKNRAAWEGFLANLNGALHTFSQHRSLEVHSLPMQSRSMANDDLTLLKDFAVFQYLAEWQYNDPVLRTNHLAQNTEFCVYLSNRRLLALSSL